MIDPNMPFDWNHIRAFLTTAEEGSLSAAARKLGQTQPTVGRQVAALEADLGVMLFERVGRSLALTVAGGELLEHVRAMRAAADRVALVASGQRQTVAGRVVITASDVYSVYLLPPILRELRAKAPRLIIDVVASDDVQDLMRREADIAVRHVRPEQPDLIARLVREANGYFYAATDYLERRGRPQALEDLTAHDFIGSGNVARMLAHLTPLGFPITEENFRTGSDSGLVAWEMCKQGFGIAPMAEEVAEMTPGVERILPKLDPIVFPIWLTTHRELHNSRRMRLVFDTLAAHLAGS
ncbi:LysR family transcriptional regulator [Shimia marina]|nr:LysR family transcriptional regulator [Shimia marina]